MATSTHQTKCDICYQNKMQCACPRPMARRLDPADAAAAEQQLKTYKIQHTKELSTLTSMGFAEDASVEALLQTQGNVEKAANYLVLKQAQQERAQIQLMKQRGSQSNLLSANNNSISRLADPRFKTQPYASVDHSHSQPRPSDSVSGANSGGRMQPPVVTGSVFAINDWVKFTHDSRTLVGQVTDTKVGNENRLWCQVQSSDLPSNMKWIQADSLSLYQPEPSPAPVSPRRPPAVIVPVQSPSKSVKPAVSPSAPAAKSPANAPASSSKDPFFIDVDTYLDVRDSVGKWLEAQVVKKNSSSVLIHFLRWDEKWDEWLDLEKDRARFAPFHTYSAGGINPDFAVETHVWVRPSVLSISTFVPGFVRKVDGCQVQVQFEYDHRRYQAWFHVKSEEMLLNEPNSEVPPPPPPEEEPVEKTKTLDGKWFKGQYVEVLDTVGKWLPAEVMQVSNDDRLLIHYENWSSKWDEWLHPITHAARLRSLGADIQESPEEALKKEEDEKFRKSMKDKGLIIVDCEKDGNCLFRAVAHQIYGDPELHETVRLACYSYMERDRDYFSQYLGEDFDTYVQRQKQLMQWGDQPELMAMREMYNKELELYQPGKTLVPKPIGGGGSEVKVMRLSFHGRNHYNSVIDPHDPPPLGEGHNVKVSFRDLRLAEQARERAAAKQRQADQEEKGAPPAAQRQPSYYDTVGRGSRSSSSHSHSILRAVDATPQLQKADFDELWHHYDPSSSGTLKVQEVEKILNKLFDLLHRRMQALLRTQGDFQKIESLNKTYDDEKGNLRDYCSELLTPSIDPTTRLPLVSYAKARDVFLSVVAPRLQWALGKL